MFKANNLTQVLAVCANSNGSTAPDASNGIIDANDAVYIINGKLSTANENLTPLGIVVSFIA